MKRRGARFIPSLLVGALILLLGPWPSPLPSPTPGEAQVGGSVLPDTTRLMFKVFKIPKGQRELVSYSREDSAACDSCTNKDLKVWGSFKNTGTWPSGGTVIPAFAGGSSATSYTPNQYLIYDATLKKFVASGTGTGTFQPLDDDLTDLADGSLTGSKVGSGIDAANITTGNLPIARVTPTDGSGSGLDADLLDGQNLVSGATTANTVAGRDASGRIQVADPSGATDAVSKQYMDANAGVSATWTWIGGCSTSGAACGSWDLDSYTAKEFLLAYAGGGTDNTESNWSVSPSIYPSTTMQGFSGSGGYYAKIYILQGYGALGTSTTNRKHLEDSVDGVTCTWKVNTASTNVYEGFGNGTTCYFALWYRN